MDRVIARWVLWVDGVGGFLMLPGDDWTIGGASGSEDSEICIQSDLASRAACVRRQGGDYVLQPFSAALLGGRRMHRPTLLRDGDLVTLRSSSGEVRFAFAKPHPLSSSARLSLDSRHRIRPHCDAILLLADTCILGPSRSSHVVAANAENQSVLLFNGGRWWCRGEGETTVDGQLCDGRFEVPPGTRIESGGLAFSLEAL